MIEVSIVEKMSNLISVTLELTLEELKTLESAIRDAVVIPKYEKELYCARLLEEMRTWQIEESKRLITAMATELDPLAPNVDNMIYVSGMTEELNLLAEALGCRTFVTLDSPSPQNECAANDYYYLYSGTRESYIGSSFVRKTSVLSDAVSYLKDTEGNPYESRTCRCYTSKKEHYYHSSEQLIQNPPDFSK